MIYSCVPYSVCHMWKIFNILPLIWRVGSTDSTGTIHLFCSQGFYKQGGKNDPYVIVYERAISIYYSTCMINVK